MAELRSCTVSYRDPEGMTHSIEVTAESLYEAAVLALKAFRAQEWGNGPSSVSQLVIAARPMAVSHTVTVGQVEAWLSSNGKSPREHALKKRLRELLRDERKV